MDKNSTIGGEVGKKGKKQLDLFESMQARDQALEQVSTNAKTFMEAATIELLKLPKGEYTGEEIRINISNKGIGPHHPNAWGALIMYGLRNGILSDTGKISKMKTKTSHARKTSIYTKS